MKHSTNEFEKTKKGAMRFFRNWERDAQKQGDAKTAETLGMFAKAIYDVQETNVSYSLKDPKKGKGAK